MIGFADNYRRGDVRTKAAAVDWCEARCHRIGQPEPHPNPLLLKLEPVIAQHAMVEYGCVTLRLEAVVDVDQAGHE
jgi:hypothetical protein